MRSSMKKFSPFLLSVWIVLVNQIISEQDFYCNKPVDVAVLIDTSSYVGAEEFKKQVTFAKTFITYFELSGSGLAPHIAFVPYGARITESNTINFRFSTNIRYLSATIDARIRYSGDVQSRLDSALQYTADTLFQRRKGVRSWVPHVVIAITGSVEYWGGDEKDNVKRKADIIQKEGIQFFLASVGQLSNNNKAYLHSLVASKDDLYLVRYMYGLTQIAEKMVRKLCPVPNIFACPAIVDLVFIVDSSGSISTADYNKMKYFMYSITNALNISDTGAHVGVVIYSKVAQVAIKLNDHKDVTSFKKAVYRLPHMKSYTRIDLGLNVAYSQLLTSSYGGARPHVKKLAFILTDGQQSSVDGVKPSVKQAARPLIESGIRTVAIGIGSAVDKKELRSMVANDNDVIVTTNFDELTKRIQNISQFACKAVGPAICENILDIAFIIDSSGSINVTEFNKAKQFILALSNMFAISATKTRIALIIYSYEARIMAKFGKIISQNELWSQLQSLPHLRGKTRIDLALRLAAAELFTLNGGMRSVSSKVAIVITDGRQSPAADAIRLDEAVVPLLLRGVKILSIGVGKKIDKYELNMMVKNPDQNVFLADSYSSLGLKSTRIANEACNIK